MSATRELRVNSSKFTLITLITGVLFGVIFWIIWGHSLHYNVYADGEFWYSEEFTEFGKTVITAGLSLVFGVSVAVIALIMEELFRTGHN